MLVNDLTPHLAAQRQALLDTVARVIDSGWLVLGPSVQRFEAAFAAYVGVPHAVGVANGTDALRLSLKAAGVQAGDAVWMVANAGGYGAIAAHQLGAKPQYLDVNLDTQVLQASTVANALSGALASNALTNAAPAGTRPKALILTHLYGRLVPDSAAIAALCREHGVTLIEDCAQAHGARLRVDSGLGEANAEPRWAQAGSFGDLACLSFYPTKNLGALGDGGAVLCRDGELAQRLRQLRQYGWAGKYEVALAGGENSRLDELQAALLSVQLPLLDAFNARRRAIVNAYIAGIRHAEVTLPAPLGEDCVGHLAVIRSPRRDALRGHLKAQDIGCDVHYPIADHQQPVWRAAYPGLRLPNTEQLAREVLSLPCYPEMTDAQVQQVVDAVNSWV